MNSSKPLSPFSPRAANAPLNSESKFSVGIICPKIIPEKTKELEVLMNSLVVENQTNDQKEGNDSVAESNLLIEKFKIAVQLVKDGADPEVKNQQGKKLLELLLNVHDDLMIFYAMQLIHYNANPAATDRRGNSILHHLVNLDKSQCEAEINLEYIDWLREHLYNDQHKAISAENHQHLRPIMIAINKFLPEKYLIILSRIDTVSGTNSLGQHCLHFAAQQGNTIAAEFLIKKLENNLYLPVVSSGSTALYSAIKAQQFKFARWLVNNKNANVLHGLAVQKNLTRLVYISTIREDIIWLIDEIKSKLQEVSGNNSKKMQLKWQISAIEVSASKAVFQELNNALTTVKRQNSQLRAQVKSTSWLQSLNLIERIEELTADAINDKSSPNAQFRGALEELLSCLDIELNAISRELNIKTFHNNAILSNTPPGIIATRTSDLLYNLKIAKTKREKLFLILEYENACKAVPGWVIFSKVLAIVCVAAVGFVLGVALGMAIGLAAGAWTGPGAFFSAAIGAATAAVITAGSFAGLIGAMGTGLLLFNSPPPQHMKKVDRVMEAGKKLYMSQSIEEEYEGDIGLLSDDDNVDDHGIQEPTSLHIIQ